MSFAFGVGIITYNRKEILSDTIDRVRSFTRGSEVALIVADDGSTDGTLAMLGDKKVPFITGVNRGIAWNKNRALFVLSQMLGCETVILLEDDTQPTSSGWETAWLDAADRWGHVNYAADWMHDHFLSGTGTASDPVRSRFITAQCAAYSCSALTYGGYFDSRFKGYGHEHVEHSRRLVRVGYGGTDERINGQDVVTYYLLKGELSVVHTPSFRDVEQEALNLELATGIMGAQGYRSPWGDDNDMRQFRSEVARAMSEGSDRFRLSPNVSASSQTAERGVFARLFHRT